jgi:hypothetical protein
MDRLDHGDKMHTSPHGYIGAGWAPNITFASAQLFWFFLRLLLLRSHNAICQFETKNGGCRLRAGCVMELSTLDIIDQCILNAAW